MALSKQLASDGLLFALHALLLPAESHTVQFPYRDTWGIRGRWGGYSPGFKMMLRQWRVTERFVKMPRTFTHEEYPDMVYVYGYCNGNANAAVDGYWRRYPQYKKFQLSSTQHNTK